MGLKGKEILVIDDMLDVRRVVKLILESDGAIISEAESVDQALPLVASKAFHLIITDLMMPAKSGFDFLRARRANEGLARIPTIVLSGLNNRSSVTEAIAWGADDYVLKPIRATTLLQKARKRLKDQTFISRRFDENRPRAEVALSVDVTEASEVGLRIDAAVKLAANETVTLSGAFMDSLGGGDLLIRAARAEPIPSVPGRYRNDLNFVGIGEATVKALRKRLKALK